MADPIPGNMGTAKCSEFDKLEINIQILKNTNIKILKQYNAFISKISSVNEL